MTAATEQHGVHAPPRAATCSASAAPRRPPTARHDPRVQVGDTIKRRIYTTSPQRRLHLHHRPRSLIAGHRRPTARRCGRPTAAVLPTDYTSARASSTRWVSRRRPTAPSLPADSTAATSRAGLTTCSAATRPASARTCPPAARARPLTHEDAGGAPGGPRHHPRLHGRGGDRSRLDAGIKRVTARLGGPAQPHPLQGPVLGPRGLGARDGGGRDPAAASASRQATPYVASTSSTGTARATSTGRTPTPPATRSAQGFGLTQPRRRQDRG